MKKLGDVAQKAKVKIGVENCNSEQRLLLSPREFSVFLDDINNPWVGIHLDVGNIHDTGFAEQWIEIHGPRITRIHVKDVMKHRGQSVYTNVFLGDNNWRAIRDAMTKVNYDGWIIAEMEPRLVAARLAHSLTGNRPAFRWFRKPLLTVTDFPTVIDSAFAPGAQNKLNCSPPAANHQ